MPTKLATKRFHFNPVVILIIGLLALAAGVIIYLKASASRPACQTDPVLEGGIVCKDIQQGEYDIYL